ncbi:hypothetical protein CR513_47627, partial [Mucuna pruriens]
VCNRNHLSSTTHRKKSLQPSSKRIVMENFRKKKVHMTYIWLFKTCMMGMRQEECDLEVKIREDVMPQVSKFKYLTSILQNDEKINEDVTHKI